MKEFGPYKGINSHQAEAIVVHCMDFRFQEAFTNFLKERNFAGCDKVAIAGGVLDQEQVEKHVKIAFELHHIKKVILINHRFCGAYGKELQKNPQEEFERHGKDLKEMAEKIKTKYPHLEIETWFAEAKPQGEDLIITLLEI